MGVSTFKRSAIVLGKDGAGKDFKAFGATSGAYMRWNKATDTLELVNANFDVVGDIEIEGDVTLTTEDISIIQGRKIFVDGQDGGEYITSSTAGELDLFSSTKGMKMTSSLTSGTMVGLYNTSQTLTGGWVGFNVYMTGIVPGSYDMKGIQIDMPASTGLYTQCIRITTLQTMGEVIWITTDQTLGEIINMAFSTTTLAGAMTGINLDMSTNVTHGSQVMTGINIAAPSGSTSTGIVLGSNLSVGLEMNATTITEAGDVLCNDAAGPTLQNEAATTTNPTLIPNRTDETTGIGWNTAEVVAIVSGSAVITVAAATVTFAQKIVQDDATVSTTTTSGSIQTDGGMGVVLASFFGGLVTANGDTGFRYVGTLVPDASRLDYGLGIGLRGSELTVNLGNAASQNLDPIQMNINLTASGGAPTSTSTVNGIYQLITHDTVNMPNLRMKCSDWTIVADNNFQDAYVYQGELDIVGNVTIGGEAFAGSFYLNAGTGTYTVNDRLAALFAIVSGTATVTGDYNVAQFMASANADVDSVLYLNTNNTASPTQMLKIEPLVTTGGIVLVTSGSGAYDAAIQVGGSYKNGLEFTEDPIAADSDNSFINIGKYGTAIAVAPTTDHMFGIMHNVTMTANVAYWYQAAYTKITTSGTTTSTSVAGHALRMEVGSDLGAVYGIQSHVTISGARTITGEVSAGSFYLNVGAGASSASSRINALQALVTGAGTITGSYYVADFGAFTNAALDAIVNIQNDSGSSGTSAIKMDLDGATTYAFDFQGLVADGWTSGDLTGSDEFGAFNEYVLIPVRIAGVSPTLYVIAAETWKNVTV